MLNVKVLYFGKELGLPDAFEASDGWMDGLRKRFNILFKTIAGMVYILNFAYKISYLNVYKVNLSMEM